MEIIGLIGNNTKNGYVPLKYVVYNNEKVACLSFEAVYKLFTQQQIENISEIDFSAKKIKYRAMAENLLPRFDTNGNKLNKTIYILYSVYNYDEAGYIIEEVYHIFTDFNGFRTLKQKAVCGLVKNDGYKLANAKIVDDEIKPKYGTLENTDAIPESVLLAFSVLTNDMYKRCPSMHQKKVIVPDNIRWIGKKCFWGNDILEEVVFSPTSQLHHIDNYAFFGCEHLNKVTLPPSIEHIGNSAFGKCYCLTQISVPDGCTISEDAFVCVPANSSIMPVLKNNYFSASAGTVKFNDTVTTITREMCRCLFDYIVTNLIIPKSVEQMSKGAFYKCSHLFNATILSNNLKVIPKSLFANCENLKSTTFSSGVERIDELAFANCKALQSVTLPSSLVSIGAQAFANCRALQSITIPSNVESIEDGAFGGCDELQKIIFATSKLKCVSPIAFKYCNKLQQVVIPYDFSFVDLHLPSTVKFDCSDFILHKDKIGQKHIKFLLVTSNIAVLRELAKDTRLRQLIIKTIIDGRHFKLLSMLDGVLTSTELNNLKNKAKEFYKLCLSLECSESLDASGCIYHLKPLDDTHKGITELEIDLIEDKDVDLNKAAVRLDNSFIGESVKKAVLHAGGRTINILPCIKALSTAAEYTFAKISLNKETYQLFKDIADMNSIVATRTRLWSRRYGEVDISERYRASSYVEEDTPCEFCGGWETYKSKDVCYLVERGNYSPEMICHYCLMSRSCIIMSDKKSL